MTRLALLTIGSILALSATTALAERADVYMDNARIIDGDTIDVGSTRIRLYGIDTFEKYQKCTLEKEKFSKKDWYLFTLTYKDIIDGETLDCGKWAIRRLVGYINGRQVLCISTGKGFYGRVIGKCWVYDGLHYKNINRVLVRLGVAFSYWTTEYKDSEVMAKSDKLGLWKMSFKVPSVLRREKRKKK